MKKIMTHLIAGYPDIQTSRTIAEAMLEAGVGFLEIQIPFSDPVVDGEILMNANETALKSGITTSDCFNFMTDISKMSKAVGNGTELLFMTYFNIVFAQGVENFCRRAAEAGAWGLIVPDIPLDEEFYEHYIAHCRNYNLHPIQIVSPSASPERISKIAEVSSGFVYCVSRFGTTGMRENLQQSTGDFIENLRKHIDIPLALGFGISTPEHIKTAFNYTDIVVIGSKIVKIWNNSPFEQKIGNIKEFLREITAQ